jgi:Mrp family chromosome partitioning ATPase
MVALKKKQKSSKQYQIKEIIARFFNKQHQPYPSYRYLARLIEQDYPCQEEGKILLLNTLASLKLSDQTLLMLACFMQDELHCRILLVDATLMDKGISASLGCTHVAGFVNFLYEDEVAYQELIQATQYKQIDIFPTGYTNKSELLSINSTQVKKIQTLFTDLRQQYDYILLQQDSFLVDTRYLIFARLMDLVMVLLEEGETLVEHLESCKKLCRDHQINNVRFILSEPK